MTLTDAKGAYIVISHKSKQYQQNPENSCFLNQGGIPTFATSLIRKIFPQSNSAQPLHVMKLEHIRPLTAIVWSKECLLLSVMSFVLKWFCGNRSCYRTTEAWSSVFHVFGPLYSVTRLCLGLSTQNWVSVMQGSKSGLNQISSPLCKN